ncbi:MAG TPA: hypothetical protein VM095_20210 [Pyrinomonadaceae bacterium]|nr:hypothetical protein [Pyrinomonadaceae bacterium]
MPGRCPSCNQTYTDETLTFCPNDGTPLVRDAPPAYDQQYGAQPPGNYPPPPPPPPQGGYYPGAPQQPGGGQAPPPGWQQPPPYGQQQQQQYQPQYGGPAPGGKSKMPLIIGAVALLLIGGGVLYFLLSKDKTSTSNSSTTSTTSTPSTTRSPGTTTSTYPTTSTPTTTTGGSYSEDDKHKLFQAVGITQDNALIIEVAQKIGIVDSSGQPKSNFQTFVQDHYTWATKNADFIRTYLDKDKARQYVMANK